MMASHALVRVPSPRFGDALRSGEAVPDPQLARRQHREYVAALADAGLTVIQLPPSRDLADSCFVEDRAVVLGDTALITRSLVPSRRGEAAEVGTALAPYLKIRWMAEPATLDGGDVLRLGRTVFVGLSTRTNAAGLAAMRELAEPLGLLVRGVEVRQALHLKSVATALGEAKVVVLAGSLDPAVFGCDSVMVREPLGANVVMLEDRVLMSSQATASVEAVRRAGHHVVPVDLSEFAKADGSPTCLSILFGPSLSERL